METILNKDQLHDLLYQALETEMGGVLLYEAALRCAINDDLKKEWTEYLEQTREHVKVLLRVFKKLGLGPDVETPGRQIVRHTGQSLVKTIEMAIASAKPAAAQIVAAECVVHAETKDHANWELIGLIAEQANGAEREVLKEAYDQVEDQEDEHLYHTKGWARELSLESLSLDAVLPPPEEKKDVKSATEAAQVKKERKSSAGRKKEKVG